MTLVLFILISLSIVLTQVLAGGRSLALCLPGYGLLALAALLSWWPMRRAAVSRMMTGCLAAAALFFCYVTLRATFSAEEYLARKDLFVALAAMSLYLLVALNLTSPKVRLALVVVLLLLGSANSVIAAIQFFKDESFMVFDFLLRADYGQRASGFFIYPNYLAAFLTTTSLLGLSVTFWSRWPLAAKIVAGYLSLVCLLGLLLTGSRGGYISCAVGLLLIGILSLLALRKSEGTRPGLIIAAILTTLVLAVVVRQSISQSYALQSRASATLVVDGARMMFWKAGWEQSQVQPVTGTGSGTYLYYGRQFRDPKMQADPVFAHNEFLQLLAEYGILGLTLALSFLVFHFRSGWKSFGQAMTGPRALEPPDRNHLALVIGAISAATACVIHAFFDFTLHSPANMLVAALLFGMLAGPRAELTAKTGAKSAPPLSPYFRLALPALGLWIAIKAMPTLPAEYFSQRALNLISQAAHMTSADGAWEAERLANRGLTWDARNPDLYYFLGSAKEGLAVQTANPAVRRERLQGALLAYQKAIDLAPKSIPLILAAAATCNDLENFSEARTLLERAVQLDPNSGWVRFALANHLHMTGKLSEAEVEYRKAWELGSGAAAAGLQRLQEERKAQQPPNPTPAEKSPAP